MKHRHINEKEWTQAALDSLFERGDLPDWKELHADLKAKPGLRKNVEKCAARHPEMENFVKFFLRSVDSL